MAQDKIASIFKRGGQKAEYGASSAAGEGGGLDGADAEQQLEQHLEQLAVAWAAPKLKCAATPVTFQCTQSYSIHAAAGSSQCVCRRRQRRSALQASLPYRSTRNPIQPGHLLSLTAVPHPCAGGAWRQLCGGLQSGRLRSSSAGGRPSTAKVSGRDTHSLWVAPGSSVCLHARLTSSCSSNWRAWSRKAAGRTAQLASRDATCLATVCLTH